MEPASNQGQATGVRICPRCGSIYVTAVQWCGIDGETLVDQEQDPLVGRAIERYEITERLGMGGMGCVYRAKHAIIDRDYAIKVLYGDFAGDDKFRARFKREAQSISKIRHPNVVQVEDFGTTSSGLTFLTMELVKGRTLEEVITREAPLSPIRTANIARQVAAGLDAAHALGFVHRDVKPSNIMLLKHEDFEGEFVKILDFGTVSLREIPTDERLTSIGHIIGTPTYMAPEQSQDPGVAPTADVYALGCIMHEMLAGDPPFLGAGRAEVMVKHITEEAPPAPPSRGLEGLIKRMLQKHPSKRPQSCAEIVRAIAALNFGLPKLPDAARPRSIRAAGPNGLAEAAVDQDAFFSAPTNHMLIDYPADELQAAVEDIRNELPTPPSDPANFDMFPSLTGLPAESGEWDSTWSAGSADAASLRELPIEAAERGPSGVAFREEGGVAHAVDPLDTETSVSPRSSIENVVRTLKEADDRDASKAPGQQNRSTLIVRQREVQKIDTSDLTVQPEAAEVLFEPERPSDKPPVPEDDAGATQVDFQMGSALEHRPVLVPTESLQAVSFIDDVDDVAASAMDTVPPPDLEADTPEDRPGDPGMGTAPTNPHALQAPLRPPTPIKVEPTPSDVETHDVESHGIESADVAATVLSDEIVEITDQTAPAAASTAPSTRLPERRNLDAMPDATPMPKTVEGAPAHPRPVPRSSSSLYPIAIVVLLLAAALLGSMLYFGSRTSEPVDLSPPVSTPSNSG